MKPIILCLLILTTVFAEEPAFDRCLKTAKALILADKYDQAMNEIRVGINVYWYEEKHLDAGLEKEYADAYESSKDKMRRSNLAIGMSSFFFIKKDIIGTRKWLGLAEENEPKKPEVHNMRGVTLLWENKNEAAIIELSKALENRPNYLDALYNRANLYLKAGLIEKAVIDRERYQRIIQLSGVL